MDDGYGLSSRTVDDLPRARHAPADHRGLRHRRRRGGRARALARHGRRGHGPPPARRLSCRTVRSCTPASAATRPTCARPGGVQALAGAVRGGRPGPGGAGRRARRRRARHRRRPGAARRREPRARAARPAGAARHSASGPAGADAGRARRSPERRRADARFALAPRINAAGRLYHADAGSSCC